jgi:hypothetical protein
MNAVTKYILRIVPHCSLLPAQTQNGSWVQYKVKWQEFCVSRTENGQTNWAAYTEQEETVAFSGTLLLIASPRFILFTYIFLLLFYCFYIYLHVYTLFVPPLPQPPSPRFMFTYLFRGVGDWTQGPPHGRQTLSYTANPSPEFKNSDLTG